MGVGKRGTLAKLPQDWREKMVAEALRSNAGDRFKAAVAVLMASGCRPEELAAGVACVKRPDGRIELRIKGAKTGTISNGEVVADRGQPWRTLVLDADSSEATQHIAALCSNKVQTIKFNKDSLRTMVKRVARRVYPKHDGRGISPYCFRHAMAADLKSCDTLTDEQRAMVLGHLSVESIASYGRRRRGGGGRSPVVAVKAAKQPRGGISHQPPAASRSNAPRLG